MRKHLPDLLDYLLLPFRVIFKIYYLVFFVISLILLFPFHYYLLSDPQRYPKAFLLMRFHAFLLLLFAGSILIVKGYGNIPGKGAFIICPNHSSFLDVFCLYVVFKRYFVFTGKKEIEKWPLFHIFYTSGMNILVDRHSRKGAVIALRKMSQVIDKGIPLMIFPEGTISKTVPKPALFKSGAFALAIQKQVPILPVTFVTNWKRLQRSGIFKGKAGPGIAKMIIHKPIQVTGYNKDQVEMLKNHVKAIIEEPLVKA